MPADCNAPLVSDKPAKPSSDFPLFAHINGQWAKKIRGRLVYFGKWADPNGALRLWNQQKDDLLSGNAPTALRPTRIAGRKPKKPRKDFPLFAHANGQWAKKILGKLHYFGPWADPDAAQNLWLDQKDELLAGRKPRVSGAGVVTVDYLVQHFIGAKERKLQAGEMQLRTWCEYKETCKLVIDSFGRNRPIDDLQSEDFGRLRAQFAKGRGAEALSNQIRRTRSLFKYGFDADLIDRPVKFGAEFKAPDATKKRREKQAKPQRIFSAAEIRALIDKASTPLRAMVYLGINCGFGNSDCAALPKMAIDFERSIIDFPRPKTAVERRATLWPETIAAIKAAIEIRPKAKDPADDGLAFITRYGFAWVRYRDTGVINSVGLEFGKLLGELKIEREGVAFYALRHTFETIGGASGDQPAVDRIMGHSSPEIAARYREWQKDEAEDVRLRKVTDHVRKWLFEKGSKGKNSQDSKA